MPYRVAAKRRQKKGENRPLFAFCAVLPTEQENTAGTSNAAYKRENPHSSHVAFDSEYQPAPHFGHTEQFKLYETADGKIVHVEVVDTNGSGHGALAGFLMQNGVDTLICGGIGGGAQAALVEAGIKLYGGVSGDADAAVSALLNGSLSYNPYVHCDHHDHEHGEKGHTCGDHGCGKHSCH